MEMSVEVRVLSQIDYISQEMVTVSKVTQEILVI